MDLGDGLKEKLEEHGNAFNFNVLWERDAVFTVSPEHIKLVLATDFNNYEKGEPLVSDAAHQLIAIGFRQPFY